MKRFREKGDVNLGDMGPLKCPPFYPSKQYPDFVLFTASSLPVDSFAANTGVLPSNSVTIYQSFGNTRILNNFDLCNHTIKITKLKLFTNNIVQLTPIKTITKQLNKGPLIIYGEGVEILKRSHL